MQRERLLARGVEGGVYVDYVMDRVREGEAVFRGGGLRGGGDGGEAQGGG